MVTAVYRVGEWFDELPYESIAVGFYEVSLRVSLQLGGVVVVESYLEAPTVSE